MATQQAPNMKHRGIEGWQKFIRVKSRVSQNDSRVITKKLQTKQLEKQRPTRGRLTEATNPSHMKGTKLGSNVNYTKATLRPRLTNYAAETLSFFPDQKKEKISALMAEITQSGGDITEPRYQRPERAKALITRALP